MSSLLHLPQDGLPKLFRIGVKPLGHDKWFDPDTALASYLDEKQRLGRERFGQVFLAEPGTEAAQREVLELVARYLPERFPDIYRRVDDAIEIVPVGRRLALDVDFPPLWVAAQLVQEDLVLMRKGADGWRISAAALCFPSSWKLSEKFGRALHEVHAPVPDFGAGTRNAQMIERMFDNMRVETPVMRWNWSLYGDDQLFHPEDADPDILRFGAGALAVNVFLRAERQVLHRLPESGDILFTIRIYIDPLAELEQQPEAGKIAQALIDQLNELDAAQLAYKGLTLEKQRLLARLQHLE